MQMKLEKLDQRVTATVLAAALLMSVGCSRSQVRASDPEPEASALPTVGVAAVTVRPISRQLTVSSELVPFQEIERLRQGVGLHPRPGRRLWHSSAKGRTDGSPGDPQAGDTACAGRGCDPQS